MLDRMQTRASSGALPSLVAVAVVIAVLIANGWWFWSQEVAVAPMDLVARLAVLRQDRAGAEPETVTPIRSKKAWEKLAPPVEVPADRLSAHALAPEPLPEERIAQVGQGDTLNHALDRLFIHGDPKRKVIEAYRTLHDPRLIRPGQRLFAQFSSTSPMDADTLLSLVIAPEGRGEGVSIVRELDDNGGTQFRARPGGLPGHMHRQVLRCSITGGLELSLRRCGHDAGLSRLVAALLSLRLDLRSDLKLGDELRVVFDELVAADQRIRYERVVGLQYTGPKVKLVGASWEDRKGRVAFFTPKGEALEPMFVRDLVYGARLTSVFGMRMHPILRKMKPHLGIDLAAPTGTPIRAASDGVLIARRRSGAAGKLVRIRHGRGFSSEYFHMNGFARGLYPGNKVRRGQIIGYVGTTGRSTAPHLHFGVKKGGVHVDPLTAFDTPGKAVPPRELEHFKADVQPILALLNRIAVVAKERGLN